VKRKRSLRRPVYKHGWRVGTKPHRRRRFDFDSLIRQDIIQHILYESQQRRVIEAEARALSIIESLHDQLDPEMKGWHLAAGLDTRTDITKSVTSGDLDILRKESQKAFYRNPYGRNIINTYVKFVIGKGVIVDFKEKSEETLAAIIKWWGKFVRLNKWYSFQREFVIRSLRDGEVFVRKFIMPDSPPILRFVDPERVGSNDIKNPDGIETDPEDVEHIVAYHIWKNGLLDTVAVPAEQIIHFKMGVDRNVRRGRPILESMLPYITKYEKWLDARMVLNIVRTSVALVRHVKGSPTNIASLRSAISSNKTSSSETDKSKMLRSGTIITASPGVEYEMLSPNLEARDAAQDGRTILLALAAAAGLPDSFVTGDFSSTNFASMVVAQNPALRAFEEHEKIYSEPFSEIILWCLNDGIEKGELPEIVNKDGDGSSRPINTEFEISYPPLLKRDLNAEVEAWQRMVVELGVSSKRTASLNLGLDPDQEKKLIEEEDIDDSNTSNNGANGNNDGNGRKTKPVAKRVEDREPRDDVLGSEVQSKQFGVYGDLRKS